MAVLLALFGAGAGRADMTLVLAEQRGCIYCAQWDAEVAPVYAKTAEGRAAPLRRVDIHRPLPEDLTFTYPLRITPTFVLMRDGLELERLEGYPGEGFFWGLLQRMIEEAEVPDDANG